MSSRNRRNRVTDNQNPFFVDESAELPTFESVDRKGYGGPLLEKLDKHINARPIPIAEIHPDPKQPRRTIPFAVRERWNASMDSLFETWKNEIDRERGDSDFDIQELLAVEGDEVRNPNPKPLEASLLGVIDLAASILRDGLTNPITIVRNKNKYFLETGERRWLAYHLLHQQMQDDQWAKIPARVMDEFSVWRQAGENNARDNLNAIGRARQFALLLMELYREENIEFDPFDKTGESDRSFYAQVADGEKWRIPRGKAELLLNAIGLKSVRQLSQYRALLNLPDAAWIIADDSNLSEYRLRYILEMKLDESATLEAIQRAALEYGEDSGTVVPVSEKSTEKSSQKPQEGTAKIEDGLLAPSERKDFKKFMDFVGSVSLGDIPNLDKKQKHQLLSWAQNIKRLVAKIEQAASENQTQD